MSCPPVKCNQCIGCEKTEIKNHGKSICYDKNGNRNCGYYGLCCNVSNDAYACKLYFPKRNLNNLKDN